MREWTRDVRGMLQRARESRNRERRRVRFICSRREEKKKKKKRRRRRTTKARVVPKSLSDSFLSLFFSLFLVRSFEKKLKKNESLSPLSLLSNDNIESFLSLSAARATN